MHATIVISGPFRSRDGKGVYANLKPSSLAKVGGEWRDEGEKTEEEEEVVEEVVVKEEDEEEVIAQSVHNARAYIPKTRSPYSVFRSRRHKQFTAGCARMSIIRAARRNPCRRIKQYTAV